MPQTRYAESRWLSYLICTTWGSSYGVLFDEGMLGQTTIGVFCFFLGLLSGIIWAREPLMKHVFPSTSGRKQNVKPL